MHGGRWSGRRFLVLTLVFGAYLLGRQLRAGQEGAFTNTHIIVGDCAMVDPEDRPARVAKLSEFGNALARSVRRRRVEKLGNHTYKADGLVEVNPDGAHPIYELVERAQEAWDRKVARASRTLEEAVEEYERRYHRLPPRGFDLW